MREIDIEELKKIQIEILVAIDQFCQQNSIKYSLSSGSLIGAVRHNGYIPWDDDIDIMMPRADYDRFVSSFNGVFEHLSLLAPEIDSDFYAPYANVFDNRTLLLENDNGHRGVNLGVKIDVFPIDKVASKLEDYVRDMKMVERLNLIMYVKRLENFWNHKKRLKDFVKIGILKIISCCFPYSYLQRKIKSIAVNESNIDSEYVDNAVFNIYSRKITRFKKTVMEDYINMPFEGQSFSVVKDYDSVLRKMYGDYMQLPPENQRVPHHNFNAYWID